MRTETGISTGMFNGGSDEGEEGGLTRGGLEVEDRSGAEEVVGVAFVVGVDGDQAGLGIGGALIEGEVGGGALGDRVGVAEDAAWGR